MKLRGCNAGDVERVQEAIALLRKARALLVEANAPKSADKVRCALKSAEGAERHVWRRYHRSIGTHGQVQG